MNNTTKLKDLRVLAGRAEATITALKLGVDAWDPKDAVMVDRAHRLAVMIRDLREQIEALT